MLLVKDTLNSAVVEGAILSFYLYNQKGLSMLNPTLDELQAGMKEHCSLSSPVVPSAVLTAMNT